MGDPSHNMDELLRTYARKRREEGGDPPPLHAAMRHQLQEEVRRSYALPTHARRPWFARFLLRPAMAGALALAMVTVGLFLALWPQTQPLPVATSAPPASPAEREALDRKSPGDGTRPAKAVAAKSSSSLAATSAPEAAKESPAVAAPILAGQVLRRDETVPSAPRAPSRPTVAGDAVSQSPPPTSAATIAGAKVAEGIAADEARALAAPARGRDLAKQEHFRNVPLQSTRFLNQAAPSARRDGSPAILQSFHVNRVGNEVVFVDADGSIYRGSVEPAASDMDKLADQNVKLKSDTSRLGFEQKGGNFSFAAQGFAFRVRGTNTTLRQAIEITGNYSPPEPQEGMGRAGAGLASPSQAANALDYQDSRSRAQQLQNAPFVKGRIQGRARLADMNEIEVDAVATPSP